MGVVYDINCMATDFQLPLFSRAAGSAERTALLAPEGTWTYGELLRASGAAGSRLLDGAADLREARVAFLAPPGLHYAATLWGAWRAGGVAVPLSTSHPKPELEYAVADSGASVLAAHPDFEAKLRPIAEARGLRFLKTTELLDGGGTLPDISPGRRALILYTSGTTSKPKGVVTTHRNIQAQVGSLVEAWEWSRDDRILCFLPLHHIHGLINVLTCALWSGAACEVMPAFDAARVWERVARGGLTLFMAVPTVYARLAAAWEAAPAEKREAMSEGCRKMRLMVSGSAALPSSVLARWKALSGHVLLERYGMTEIGMALSNPLHGPRLPGRVGTPLPGIEVRLSGGASPAEPGEIEVRGPGVFLEYWGKPEAARDSFRGGWFRTGDVAVVEEGSYRLLGRKSVDIIKTGGYKVSAVEIEEALREHPDIADCAVVGVPDAEWGERVCAALVMKEGRPLAEGALRDWGKERMAPYKVPSRLLAVGELPRNAMGKVLKPEVARLFK
jgi:malonyl-CoA/methylmalonyl-CoA synthetase